MPTKAWHVNLSLEEIRTSLAEKLSKYENGSYWAFHMRWTGAVPTAASSTEPSLDEMGTQQSRSRGGPCGKVRMR